MTYRAIAAFPLVFVAAAATALALAPEAARAGVLHGEIEIAKVMALVGLSAAALAFDRGDYLRRAWGLSASCYVFLLTRDVWLALATGAQPAWVGVGRALLIALGNGAMVTGTWMLARAWTVAGLEHLGSRTTRAAAIAVAIALALLFAGPSLAVDVHDTFTGQRDAFWTIPSDLGDMLALPLLAPVAMTAFAVREGSLKWPWSLLSASLAAWLVYDGVLTVPELLHVDVSPYRLAAEMFRLLAAAAACAAGLAQRRAVRVDVT